MPVSTPFTDPYGIDVQLTPTGDFAVRPNGSIGTLDGPENCAQALVMRVRTYQGELSIHPEYGSGLEERLVGMKALDDSLARAHVNVEIRKVIEGDRRFLAARNITLERLADDGTRLGVSLQLELAGGEELAVADLADPRADEIETRPLSVEEILADPFDEDSYAFLDDDEIDLDELPDVDLLADDPDVGSHPEED